MTPTLPRRLIGDRRGGTIVEFAIVAPVMLLTIMGLGDLLYQTYLQSILSGAIQKAGRDSSIQGGANQTAVLDNRVITIVRRVADTATFTSSRESAANFVRMKPEPFTDKTPLNGRRDAGECFEDYNFNGQWDANPTRTGQGGANDVTLYKITVTYPRPFPIATLMGFSANQKISAQTLLKNQPYATQKVTTPPSVCT